MANESEPVAATAAGGAMSPNDPLQRDTLWAPWRLPYIVSTDRPRNGGCFLCEYAAATTGNDAANYVLAKTEQAIVVLNRYPYNNGHILIAPRAHKGCISELIDAESLECQRWIQTFVVLIRRLMTADGFNVGLNLGKVAGAGLPGHLHWHIVPRWFGDTNFMPVIAGIPVIPQSLDALYALLKGELPGLLDEAKCDAR